MTRDTNVDPTELAKFSALAHRWWDPLSEFKPLHDINPLRLSYPTDKRDQAMVAEALQHLRDYALGLTAAYRLKLQSIDALRQSLLQKAFAGELT